MLPCDIIFLNEKINNTDTKNISFILYLPSKTGQYQFFRNVPPTINETIQWPPILIHLLLVQYYFLYIRTIYNEMEQHSPE